LRTTAAPMTAAQQAILTTDVDLAWFMPIAPVEFATALKKPGRASDANRDPGRRRG
jgi:hypothetical protein